MHRYPRRAATNVSYGELDNISESGSLDSDSASEYSASNGSSRGIWSDDGGDTKQHWNQIHESSQHLETRTLKTKTQECTLLRHYLTLSTSSDNASLWSIESLNDRSQPTQSVHHAINEAVVADPSLNNCLAVDQTPYVSNAQAQFEVSIVPKDDDSFPGSVKNLRMGGGHRVEHSSKDSTETQHSVVGTVITNSEINESLDVYQRHRVIHNQSTQSQSLVTIDDGTSPGGASRYPVDGGHLLEGNSKHSEDNKTSGACDGGNGCGSESHSYSVCKPQPLKCRLCRNLFQTVYGLETHVEMYHKSGLWGITCEMCHRVCTSTKSYSLHKRRNHNMNLKSDKFPSELSMKCDKCDRYFRGTKRLAVHNCKGDTPAFKCSYCNRSFVALFRLVDHLKAHAEVKEYLCEICGRSYVKNSMLMAHQRTAHCNGPRVCCSVCSKSFKQESALHVHMRVHTGERPYKCSVCSQAFKMSGHLVNHVRVHTGERPFVCKICGKAFITTGNRINHMKTHIS